MIRASSKVAISALCTLVGGGDRRGEPYNERAETPVYASITSSQCLYRAFSCRSPTAVLVMQGAAVSDHCHIIISIEDAPLSTDQLYYTPPDITYIHVLPDRIVPSSLYSFQDKLVSPKAAATHHRSCCILEVRTALHTSEKCTI